MIVYCRNAAEYWVDRFWVRLPMSHLVKREDMPPSAQKLANELATVMSEWEKENPGRDDNNE